MLPNKESNIEKELPNDSPLKRLIKIFRTNTVVKHHFQGNGSTRPIGVAKSFFKNSYQNASSTIAGYVGYERMARYSDYCEMISYPILGKALQIYADECTQKDEDGKIIKITSESREIQEILQDLIDNVLQLNGKKINKIVRDLCKYGDTFYLIDITTDNGVVNLIQMPANEVDREEGYDKDEPTAVKFKWAGRNSSQEIPNAFVAHFRYDGDDMFYPFGMSILEAARRPWRQLCLSSNTEIWTKNGHKKIKDIIVGDEVVSFDQQTGKTKFVKVKNALKTGTKKTFTLRSAHREIDLTSDHQVLVKTSEGSFVYKAAKDIVLSNGKGGQSHKGADKLVLPRTVHGEIPEFSADKNQYSVKLLKANEESLNVVSKLREVLGKDNVKNEHAFLKSYKNRKISFSDYAKISSCFAIDESNVEYYLNNSKNKSFLKDFKFVPSLDFVRFLGFMYGDGWLEKNGIGFALGVYEEQNKFYIDLCHKMFGVTCKVEKSKKSNSKSSKVSIQNKELMNLFGSVGFISGFEKKRIPEWVFNLPLDYKISFLKGLVDADGENDIGCLGLSNDGLINDALVLAQQCGIDCSRKVRVDRHASKKWDKNFQKIVDRKTSYKIWLNFSQINEEQVAFEAANHLIEKDLDEDVYDIEVDDYLHNFVANGIVVHNCLLEDAMMVYRITRSAERRAFYLDVMGVPPESVPEMVENFNQELKKKKVVNEQGKIDLRYGGTLDMVEDYIVPVRGSDSATRIESLPGGQNIGDIEDIEFIKKNLFAGIGIPKAFLTFDEGVGSKQTLTVEDIRFARTVSKIQECVINEIIKICLIHLYIKGKRGRDLIDFKVKMTNPSTVAEMQKNELWRARMDLVQVAGQGVFDTTFIYKNFLKLSDEAIDMIKKGQIQDKIFQAKLLALENSGGAIGGAGGMGGGMDMMGGGMGGGLGGMGGGMGGGMDMGMGGAPPVDIGGGMGAGGGAAPNVMGMPESINVAANVFDNNAGGKMKDLSRTGVNRRLKNLRGLMDDEAFSIEDIEDQGLDSFDHDGIRRTISSPMGQNESKTQRTPSNIVETGYVSVNASMASLDSSVMKFLKEKFQVPAESNVILENQILIESAGNEESSAILESEFEKVNKMVEDFD
jgi:intein/homing endonuclease